MPEEKEESQEKPIELKEEPKTLTREATKAESKSSSGDQTESEESETDSDDSPHQEEEETPRQTLDFSAMLDDDDEEKPAVVKKRLRTKSIDGTKLVKKQQQAELLKCEVQRKRQALIKIFTSPEMK